MNTSGIIYFHQGWTDIINCLSLLNYYSEKYIQIYLVIRSDSKELVDFYTNNIKNLTVFYEDISTTNSNAIQFVINKYPNLNLQNSDFIAIGGHDHCRKDEYNNKFEHIDGCFVKGFYESYNIPYIIRVNYFIVTRDYELEDKIYNNFINLYGSNYILYHEVIEDYNKDIPIVNLNGKTNIFFDYIKILENAIEIHLLDSVWAVLIYLLDCKYQLFNNKKIFLYNKRGYRKMFEEPIKLENWIII